MRKVWFVSVCIFLTVGFWGMSIGQTFAHEQGEKEGLKEKKDVRGKLADKDRKEIRDLIDSLRIVKMTEALNLSEEQAIKVFTKMSQIEKEKRNLQKRMRESVQGLRGLIDSGAGEGEIKKSVGNIKNLRASIKGQDEALSKHLEGVLSVEQQAKCILFMEEFPKHIRKMIEHTRDLRGKEREEIDASRRERRKDLDTPPQPESMEPEQ